jgi:tetratricopeptide (TPR) repeat protein
MCLRNAGRLDQAEALLRNSIEELEKKVGQQHSLTSGLKEGRVAVLIDRGQYAEAERIYRELVDAGFADPTVDEHLAELYLKQLKLAEAEKAFRDVYESRKERFGPENPHTLNTLRQLAFAIHGLGRYSEAEAILREVVDAETRVLGPENDATLASLAGLANTLTQQGRDLEAVKICETVLDAQKRDLRPNHPSTLETMNQLAVIYWRNQQLDKSIPVFEELANHYREELSPDHPETLTIIANLGINYKDAGRLNDAISQLKQAHAAVSRYPNLLFATVSLIDAYIQKGERNEATKLVPAFLDAIHNKLPSNLLADYLRSLAQNYYLAMDAYSDAEEVLHEVLEIYEELNPDDWKTFCVKSMLGEALMGQQHYAEAESLLIEGYDGLVKCEESLPPVVRKSLTESLERLVRLYEAWHLEDPDADYDAKATLYQHKLEERKANLQTKK